MAATSATLPHRDVRAVRGMGAGLSGSGVRASARRGNRCAWWRCDGDVRLLTVKTGVDLTERMAHTRRRVVQLASEDCAATC